MLYIKKNTESNSYQISQTYIITYFIESLIWNLSVSIVNVLYAKEFIHI